MKQYNFEDMHQFELAEDEWYFAQKFISGVQEWSEKNCTGFVLFAMRAPLGDTEQNALTRFISAWKREITEQAKSIGIPGCVLNHAIKHLHNRYIVQ